ncbi:MAG: ORF6N domain-containing protein [Acidobacteria bacterium]|nr:ORF6N domain-containing protein [Acidobacteriota bacterium]
MKRDPPSPPPVPLPVPIELIERRIYLIRGHKVMLDSDLADLYQAPTRAFNQAVKRNLDRFPDDFMFQLTKEEASLLRSQSVTSSWGGRRYLPYAFTQEGVAMLSSVLSSPRAIKVNIAIMRVFVRLRQLADTHRDLAQKIAAMEKKYDTQFRVVFEAIKKLLDPPPAPAKRRIGFAARDEQK